MNRKVDQLSSRLNEIEIKVTDTKTLAEDNRIRTENLVRDRLTGIVAKYRHKNKDKLNDNSTMY